MSTDALNTREKGENKVIIKLEINKCCYEY